MKKMLTLGLLALAGCGVGGERPKETAEDTLPNTWQLCGNPEGCIVFTVDQKTAESWTLKPEPDDVEHVRVPYHVPFRPEMKGWATVKDQFGFDATLPAMRVMDGEHAGLVGYVDEMDLVPADGQK